MKSKVINKVSAIIDVNSVQGKIIGGVVMGLLGALLGGTVAELIFAIGASSMHSTSLILVISGLLFLVFLDKLFL